jgi:catecholate siderophore receptor
MADKTRRNAASRFKLHPAAAAIMMAFTVPAAHAQTAGEQALPEVEVTSTPQKTEGFRTDSTPAVTRTETPLRDIPQFVNIVPQELIRSQGAVSLGDALRNVPGITYAAAEGGTQANQVFYMRGFPAGGDIFIDGIRDIGEYNRDLFNIESVEVLKGPSALMFGRGSTGGVINQTTKAPGLAPLKEVGVSLGSNGEKRATADLNLPMGETSAFRLNVLGEDSDTYRDTVENKQVGVAPSVKFGIGTPTEVTLSYMYLKTDGQTDYGQPTLWLSAAPPTVPAPGLFWGMPPVDLDKYYGFANYDYTEWETNVATLRIDHRFSDGLSLRNTTRWANYQRNMEATIATLNTKDANGNQVTPSTPAELLLVNRSHNKSRDNDDTILINQTELTWKLETGAVKHTVLTGLELAKEKLDRMNYTFAGTVSATTPLLNPDPFTSLNYTKTPNDNNVSEAETVAVYAQDQIEFSPEWKALFGLRFERYDASVRQTDIATGVIVAGMDGVPIDFSRVDEMVSGRAGVIWQPTAGQMYYVAAGNSYNPSGELGVYGGTGTNLSNGANTTIDPEENRNYEVGSQWDFASGVQVRAALFRVEKVNARMTDPSDPDVIILAGKRRVDGLELSASGRITPSWDVYGAVAFMDGEIVKSAPPTGNNSATQGKTPLGVPDWAGTLWTVYRLGGGFEVGGGAFASGSWFLDDQNRGEAPSYVRWDATAAYVQKKYDVRLNLFNVLDEKYYVGGYNNSPNRVIPGLPRSAMVSLNYRFD